MTLRQVGFTAVPPGAKPGFDHADTYLDPRGSRLYVAHTGADRVDVIDCTTNTYLRSLADHPGVAGVLIDSAQDLLFTSDREASQVSVHRCSDEALLALVGVGEHPNGLAYDPARRRVFVFNLGKPAGENCTVSVVDLDRSGSPRRSRSPAPARARRALSMTFPVLATLLTGGLAALDAVPVAQTLFSQPLVTASLLGWVWGEWRVALEVGVVLQVLAASTQPVGARTPEDYATGGVAGAGLALALASQQSLAIGRDGCALVGVLAGMVTALGGVPLVRWQRRRNEALSRWCEAELRRGHEGALAQSHRAAVVLAFAVGVGYSAVSLGLGFWVLRRWVDFESLRLTHAWSVAEPLWLGLGLAQMLHAFVQRRLSRAALFGAALIASWLALMVGAP